MFSRVLSCFCPFERTYAIWVPAHITWPHKANSISNSIWAQNEVAQKLTKNQEKPTFSLILSVFGSFERTYADHILAVWKLPKTNKKWTQNDCGLSQKRFEAVWAYICNLGASSHAPKDLWSRSHTQTHRDAVLRTVCAAPRTEGQRGDVFALKICAHNACAALIACFKWGLRSKPHHAHEVCHVCTYMHTREGASFIFASFWPLTPGWDLKCISILAPIWSFR